VSTVFCQELYSIIVTVRRYHVRRYQAPFQYFNGLVVLATMVDCIIVPLYPVVTTLCTEGINYCGPTVYIIQ